MVEAKIEADTDTIASGRGIREEEEHQLSKEDSRHNDTSKKSVSGRRSGSSDNHSINFQVGSPTAAGDDIKIRSLNDNDNSEQQSAPPEAGTRQRFTRAILFGGVILTMFMVSLNATVVAPAINIIATDLDAAQDQTWIATAYLVAMNSTQPLAGKFSDIFGRKPLVLLGLPLFIFGSLINALSPNIQGLIAGRTVQGLGGGLLMSMLFIIVTDLVPPKSRPRFQSMLSVVFGLASVVGPLIGGAFVDKLTWRWDFWLNIIIGGICFVIIVLFLKEPVSFSSSSSLKSKVKRIDWFGSFFSVCFICCVLIALSWGPAYGWRDKHTAAAFACAGATLVLLIGVETWFAPEPLFPAAVVMNPQVLILYFYIMMLGISFMGALYYGPVLFQSVYGASSIESGVRLIPYMAFLIIGSLSSAELISRIPYVKLYILIGAGLNILGWGLYFTITENSSWAQQACYLVFCGKCVVYDNSAEQLIFDGMSLGLAFGLSQQNVILGVQSATKKEYIAVATALVGLVWKQTNFALMFANSIAQFVSLSEDTKAVANQYGALKNYLYIRNLPKQYQPAVIKCYMNSMHYIFCMSLGFTVVAFIVALFIKWVRIFPKKPKNKDAEEGSAGREKQQEGPHSNEANSKEARAIEDELKSND
ncbi:major facilitator superfamily domain-containing protein [Syncephalastrum racemosum]|uniref:MFS-type drug efflux transporter P55 n=1 Tax=Syncephalastrum racemosum TaxID=13706 RepID=A0A1X2HIV9_SYNRA|nr:major facilitator superfamily domain-containing protein [Syncephalastrum racemosum]